MPSYHSQIGTAAWLDLLRHLKDERVSEVTGTPRLKQVGGKRYWYDHYRIGSKTVDRYIGEDSDELRARLERRTADHDARQARTRERSRLVRILRAEGYLAPDQGTGQLLSALERVGVFRLGGTLVGTQAFRCYEGELGVRIGFDQTAMTDDIDIASFERLSVVLNDTVEEPLTDVFKQLEFDPVPSLDKGKVWRWKQTERNTLVEFLTPSFEENEGLKPLRALGVSAQSLHFLNYLIAEPLQVPLLYRSGVLIQIPRPERYAIHKLIIADRRIDEPDRLKARKDRLQAEFLIDVLAQERPDELAEAYNVARENGPEWRRRIDSTLRHLPEIARLLG